MYLLIILITIFLVFSILSMNLNINEHYCKVPPTNNQGEDNFFKADLSFKPQSNINNSNCDKYWKKFSNESNSILNLNEPIPIKGDQLKLPQEAGFGNHIYKFGLINFKELASYLNNQESNINKNIYNDKTTEKLIINPINKEKLDYLYKVDFFITTMNKETDIKRFNEYNPTQLNNFKQIQSPIPQVNILNNEFLKRINKEQIKVMSKRDIIISGNLYGSEVETPRADASYGLFLKGNGEGDFKSISPKESRLYVMGDVKSSSLITLFGNNTGIIFAKNKNTLQLFKINK